MGYIVTYQRATLQWPWRSLRSLRIILFTFMLYGSRGYNADVRICECADVRMCKMHSYSEHLKTGINPYC